jgi:hypothetical protein
MPVGFDDITEAESDLEQQRRLVAGLHVQVVALDGSPGGRRDIGA